MLGYKFMSKNEIVCAPPPHPIESTIASLKEEEGSRVQILVGLVWNVLPVSA